jgi:hypothetical protein
MSEPTREEWKDWAACMRDKEPPRYVSFYEMVGFFLGGMDARAAMAAQLQQSLADQYGNQQAGVQGKYYRGVFGGIL